MAEVPDINCAKCKDEITDSSDIHVVCSSCLDSARLYNGEAEKRQVQAVVITELKCIGGLLQERLESRGDLQPEDWSALAHWREASQ